MPYSCFLDFQSYVPGTGGATYIGEFVAFVVYVPFEIV